METQEFPLQAHDAMDMSNQLETGTLSDTSIQVLFSDTSTYVNAWSITDFMSDDVDWAPEVGGSYGLVGFGDGSGKYYVYQANEATGETTLVTTGIINGMNGFSAIDGDPGATLLPVEDPRPTYQIVASDAVIEAIVTDALDGNYDVSASYELFVTDGMMSTVGDWVSNHGDMHSTISVDQTNFEISITVHLIFLS